MMILLSVVSWDRLVVAVRVVGRESEVGVALSMSLILELG